MTHGLEIRFRLINFCNVHGSHGSLNSSTVVRESISNFFRAKKRPVIGLRMKILSFNLGSFNFDLFALFWAFLSLSFSLFFCYITITFFIFFHFIHSFSSIIFWFLWFSCSSFFSYLFLHLFSFFLCFLSHCTALAFWLDEFKTNKNLYINHSLLTSSFPFWRSGWKWLLLMDSRKLTRTRGHWL